jgi:hypothetical protein
LPEMAICQVVLLQPSIDFHASDAAIVSSRLPSPRIAVARKLRIKQQIPNSRYTRGGLHGSFDNSNCPAAQHYLGLQGTYRPEGEAAHSLTPATTLSARMEPATVEAAGCSATLSLSPPPQSFPIQSDLQSTADAASNAPLAALALGLVNGSNLPFAGTNCLHSGCRTRLTLLAAEDPRLSATPSSAGGAVS